MSKLHLDCKVEGIKNKKDVLNFVKYCKKLIKRIQSITGTSSNSDSSKSNEVVQLMLATQIKELVPYFFEFKIKFSHFDKAFREKSKHHNWTQMYYCLKTLLDQMTHEPSY